MAGRWSFERLAGVGLDPADADSVAAFVVPDGHLHGELDAICPRCLRWIEEREFVRRTAYGPLQHEVCPAEPALSS
jgi:hypothetical protein